MPSLLALISFLAALYIIVKLWQYWKALQSIQGHPGYRVLLHPWAIVAHIIGPIPAISLGSCWSIRDKHTAFKKFGCDVHSVVFLWPKPAAFLFLADADAVNTVSANRLTFPKDLSAYSVINIFGANIIVSNDEIWKRHRKVAAPAFAERYYKFVWDESIHATLSLFQEVWKNQEAIEVDDCLGITSSLGLMVFSAASFDHRLSWTDSGHIPAGHKMSFQGALQTVSAKMQIKMVLPKWMMRLTAHLRHVKLAFDEMEEYLLEMIASRRTSEKLSNRRDLLSRLVEANEEDGKMQLTDEELLSNVFIFLLAGHETTSTALCFALTLLALHQDEQSKLYEHILQVLPGRRAPTYEDMSSLTYTLAVLYETLRMFPPVPILPRVAAEDVVIRTTSNEGEKKLVVAPAGTKVTLHFPGLHYNARYWEDPHAFKPSRFLGDWPANAFMPFSIGPRSGKKFFETEAVAALTLLVSRYRIEVKEEPQFAGEAFEEKKARILNVREGITIKIRAPLTFKLRH